MVGKTMRMVKPGRQRNGFSRGKALYRVHMKDAVNVTTTARASGVSLLGMSRRVAQAERVQATDKTQSWRVSREHPCAAT